MKPSTVFLVVGYLSLLLALTFLPLGDPDRVAAKGLNLVPFKTIGVALQRGVDSQSFAVAVGNLLAFVPVGLLVPMVIRRRSLLAVLAAAVLLSLGIELGQYALSRALEDAYRSTDVDDVILNVLGAAIGYAVFVAYSLGTRNQTADP